MEFPLVSNPLSFYTVVKKKIFSSDNQNVGLVYGIIQYKSIQKKNLKTNVRDTKTSYGCIWGV